MPNNPQQPDLAEMLQEPVVQLVMARDGVSREELEDLIARASARYVTAQPSDPERT